MESEMSSAAEPPFKRGSPHHVGLIATVVGSILLSLGALSMVTGTAAAQSCEQAAVANGELWTAVPSIAVGIVIPAGTYTVIGTSTDINHAAGLQVDQTTEQWSFSTNTGVSSSVSPDLPEDQITLSFSLGDMTFPSAVSSITFYHHGAAGSANSVTPGLILRCVLPVTTTTVPITTTVAPTTSGPSILAITTTTTLASPVTTVAPTTTAEPSPVSSGGSGSSEVGSEIATNDSGELALTGINTTLAWVGAGILLFGLRVLHASHRLRVLFVDERRPRR